jgi:16S rRNA (guanine966-N2)-methyltransferase
VAPRLPGSVVVDLFAGSGALGIEALSRGASHVHFVESDRGAVAVLRDNLRSLGVTDQGTIIVKDVFRWLRAEPGVWAIALADPPYSGGNAGRLIETYRARPFADCLWVEHTASDDELAETASWSRRYGDSRVSRFCSSDATEGGVIRNE